MTTRTLTGTYSSYYISPSVTLLSIAASGYVGGYSGLAGIYTNPNSRFPVTIQNDGRVVGTVGVYLTRIGSVINGSASDSSASIQGYVGVVDESGAAGQVSNFGKITATYCGVELLTGGSVTNGSVADTRATIAVHGPPGGGNVAEGGGVKVVGAAGAVTNFGTINSRTAQGAYGDGVRLEAGGVVTNGSATDSGALIQGYSGVVASGFAAVANFGRIEGLGQGQNGVGVALFDGGRLTNGAAGGPTATIAGYYGVQLEDATGANYGVIHAYGPFGAVLYDANLTNGAAGDSGALIEGTTGVDMLLASTLTNFGTIVGTGGEAVTLENGTSTLVVEAGCAFQGAVFGNRGTLVLDSGTSAITLLANADVVISGSMATTTFSNFGVVDIDANASATLAGDGAVPGGNTLSVEGALDVAGTLGVVGSLVTSGTLSGTGTLALEAGQTTFNAGTALTIAHVSQTDPAGVVTVEAGAALAYAGKWIQKAGTLSVGAGAILSFTGGPDSFAGTLTGGGIITVSGANATLTSTTVDCSVSVAHHGALILRGVIADDGQLEVKAGGVVRIAQTGATLSGTGDLLIDAGGIVEASQATGALSNTGVILGAGGQLGAGKLALVNQISGVIAGVSGLTVIDTGANTVVNDGGMGADGGALVIKGAIDNTGSLVAELGSTLSVRGAVTGGGVVDIASQGVAVFSAKFGENVTFVDVGGVSGTLELAKSQSYGGTISGFSTTGTTSLDLNDIAFVSGVTKASYSGNSTSGLLTVTDGTHTAHVNFSGDYTASVFTVSSDGHGGTTVVDPKASAATVSPGPHAFVAAMASLGANAGTALAFAPQGGHFQRPMLARP